MYFFVCYFFLFSPHLDVFAGRDQDWTPTVLAKVTDAQQSARACRPGGGGTVGCGDPAAGCFFTSLAPPPPRGGREGGWVLFFFGVPWDSPPPRVPLTLLAWVSAGGGGVLRRHQTDPPPLHISQPASRTHHLSQKRPRVFFAPTPRFFAFFLVEVIIQVGI